MYSFAIVEMPANDRAITYDAMTLEQRVNELLQYARARLDIMSPMLEPLLSTLARGEVFDGSRTELSRFPGVLDVKPVYFTEAVQWLLSDEHALNFVSRSSGQRTLSFKNLNLYRFTLRDIQPHASDVEVRFEACAMTPEIVGSTLRCLTFEGCKMLGFSLRACSLQELSIRTRGDRISAVAKAFGATVPEDRGIRCGPIEIESCSLHTLYIDADIEKISGTLFPRAVRLADVTLGAKLDSFGSGSEVVLRLETPADVYARKVNSEVEFRVQVDRMRQIILEDCHFEGHLRLTGGAGETTTNLYLRNVHAASFFVEPALLTPLSGVDFRNFSFGLEEVFVGLARQNWHRVKPFYLQLLERDQGLPVPLQAYASLAEALRLRSLNRDATDVEVHAERRRRAAATSSLAGKLWSRLVEWTSGYGYRPGRLLGLSLGIVLFGALVGTVAPPYPLESAGPAVVTSGQVAPNAIPAAARNDRYLHDTTAPEFNALIYSLDTFLPIIDFGQTGKYVPSGRGRWGHPVQWWFWWETASGWLLATILVSVLTRINAPPAKVSTQPRPWQKQESGQ